MHIEVVANSLCSLNSLVLPSKILKMKYAFCFIDLLWWKLEVMNLRKYAWSVSVLRKYIIQCMIYFIYVHNCCFSYPVFFFCILWRWFWICILVNINGITVCNFNLFTYGMILENSTSEVQLLILSTSNHWPCLKIRLGKVCCYFLLL